MSRRLLTKGRYPKDASMYQAAAPIMQDHQPVTSNSINPSQTPEVPLYSTQPVQQQFQVSQGSETKDWQHNSIGSIPPGPNNSQQLPQPYWSGDPSYTMARPPENNAWNWTTSDHNNQLSIPQNQTIQQQQQPPPYQITQQPLQTQQYQSIPQPQQYQSVQQPLQQYPSTQHSLPQQQQDQFESKHLYQPIQLQQYQPTQHQLPQQEQYHQSMQQQQYQSLQPVYSEKETAYSNMSYISENQQEQTNSMAENNWYHDPTKHNGDQTEMSQPSWEEVAPNIAQPEQLPWTYNVPQNTSLSNSEWPNFNYIQSTVASESAENWQGLNQLESYHNSDFTSQSSDEHHDKNQVQTANHILKDVNLYQQQESDVENVESCLSISTSADDINLQSFQPIQPKDNDSGALNAFFHHSIEENVDILPVNRSDGSDISLRNHETISNQCLSSESDINELKNETLIPTSNSCVQNEGLGQNVEIPVSCQEIPTSVHSIVQEEPLNQEVPEPSVLNSLPVSQFSSKEGITKEPSDEPLNQQIPVERTTSTPTQDRSSSTAKEETAFKVVKPKSTGPIVQNEISEEPITIPKAENHPGFQEVNLETVPDNLERPPDHDELKKESSASLSSAFRQHLRPQKESHLDTSKASLWDALDSNLPCVLLPPTSFPQLIPNSNVIDDTCSSEKSSTEEVAAITSKLIDLHIKTSVTSVPSSQSPSTTPQNEISKPVTLPPQTEVPKSVSLPPSDITNIPKQNIISSGDSVKSETPQDISKSGSNSHEGTSRSSMLPQHTASSSDISSREPYPPFLSDFHHIQHSKSSSDMQNRPSTYDPSSRDRSFDKYSNHSQQRLDHGRYPGFEDRAYSDRNGSRPSSRMSLDEVADSHRQSDHDRRYQKNYASDYDRPPSRMSESGMYRRDGPRGYYDQTYHHGSYGRDDEYQQRARGYRGYDYDQYQAARQPYYNYYNPYYNYSSYNYGFYDELYRNDPRYKQHYEEQYREYYRRLGYDTDYERSSVQSGRSSVNELSKDTSQRYTDNDGSSVDMQHSQTYEQQSQFSSFDVSEGPLSTPAHRLTPSKFTAPHAIARFSNNGQLITVIPRQSSTGLPPLVEIHDMQVLTQEQESHEELKSFQGPLIRRETHKNDVIDFCVQKVKFYKQKEGIPDRDSYILLWELLILLLRQNGSVAGSDIAELLLKDHEVLQSLPHLRNAAYLAQGDRSPAESAEAHSNHAAPGGSGDASSPDEGIGDTRVKAIVNTAQSVDSERITRKFREFLLFGHKKDALEWAMKHDLWGHALFLASKMDVRTYANVMTRFANSLALNDPLQTLYQLMSGRQPAAVTCIADKQWGDWRPHLAMILSNPSPHSEVDFKSITTLGDTLASQGCLPATHFCYLMAQVEFGAFSCKSSKMVLLSANHQLSFESFATNEAIQCTEIYEYAQSLANPGFMLTHLQAYKFVYATRLADHGFLQEALHYCEVLASNFLSNPNAYPVDLVSQVYDLSSKLKYQDPHYLQGIGELDQLGDPEWLKTLFTLLQHLQQGDGQMPTPSYKTSMAEPSYAVNNYAQKPFEETPSQEIPNPEIQTDNYYSHQNKQSSYSDSWVSGSMLQQPKQPHEVQNYADHAIPQQDSYQMGYVPQWNTGTTSAPTFQHQENKNTESADDVHSSSEPAMGQRFNYYGNESQMPIHGAVQRERTTSASSMSLPRDRRDSALSSGSDYGSGGGAGGASVASGRSGEHARPEDKAEKSRPQVGKSWLGGIFSRLLPKAPNQMILPDDKNPTIVWDTQNNRWINTDTNQEDEASSPLAPPKDAELMCNSPMEISNISPMPSIAASSTPVINKFQRAKVRGMRQNYVDILNTSNSVTKAVTPNEGFFPLVPLQQNNAKVFIPQVASNDDQRMDFVSPQPNTHDASQSVSEDGILKAPPMFDPAEFDSRRSNMNSVRHSVGPAHRTYPT